jgi:chromosome segregation ATPase
VGVHDARTKNLNSFQELVLQHESTIKTLEVQLRGETLLHQSIVKRHRKQTQACSKWFCCTFQFELTHRQETNTKIEELSSILQELSKRLKNKNQEKKAAVSQLQDQHSIELAKHKTTLDDACKHYQNTLKEEQSKLQLVTQELELAKSDIVQLKTDANRNTVALEAQNEENMKLQGRISSHQQEMQSKHEEFTKLSIKIEHFRGESQNLKAERDKLLQDIDKVSQSEDTLHKEVKFQSQEIQTRQVKCGCAWCKNQKP